MITTFHQTDHITFQLNEVELTNESSHSELNPIVDFHDLEESWMVEDDYYGGSVFGLFLKNQRALEAGDSGFHLADWRLSLTS